LLRRLLATPGPEIAWSACRALSEYAFAGQTECIENLKYNSLAQSRSAELQQLMRSDVELNRHLTQGFLRDPIRMAKEYDLLPDREGITDYLQFMAQHPSPAVAARANSELKHLAN
jgi:hypothetical protein